jgi:hypothetical protein
MNNEFYTYCHYRLDDNQPFYVGKGKGNRAFSKDSRNKYWHNVVNKHGYKVEFLAYWDDESEAFEHEKMIIKCFKELGYKLCNLTDGGEGVSGFKFSDATKAKIGAIHKGRQCGDATKAKISAAMLGKQRSDDTKAKVAASMLGNTNRLSKQLSDVAKAKMSATRLGNTNRLGKQPNNSAKLKMSVSKLGNKHSLGKQNHLKYVTWATNIDTGAVNSYFGAKALREAGFISSKVSACCLGKFKTHKGHTFHREPITTN